MSLEAIEARLARELGLDLHSIGQASFARAIRTRRRALALSDGDNSTYTRLLDNDPAEWQAFVECILVPETWFFRDPAAFEHLAELAQQWLGKASPHGAPFRVLSLPCSTGEEPYSVALTLLNAGLSRDRIQVIALDLSRRVLDLAAAATYRPRAVRAVPPAVLDRYFRKTQDTYSLSPEVQRLVAFKQANALDPTILDGLGSFHAIFCRNLLIYLTSAARGQLVDTLERLMVPRSVLYVGHAERLKLLDERFDPVLSPGLFAYKRRSASGNPKQASSPPPNLPVAKPTSAPRTPKLDAHQQPPRPSRSQQPMAPQTSAGKDQKALAPGSALEQARALADRQDYLGAATLCEEVLRLRGPDATLLHLLALVRQAMGDVGEAEKLLRRALYLQPHSEEALLALSLLAERRGDLAQAARLRERAGRAQKTEVDP